MKRNRLAAIGLLLAMTCVSRTSMAAGENLVPNGTFNADLADWTGRGCWELFGSGACWSSHDAAGRPTSGSVFLSADIFTEVPVSLSSACIPITGGDTYTFGATTRVTQTDGGKGSATLSWFDDAACQSHSASDEITAATGSWQRSRLAVTAPTHAVAARVVLFSAFVSYPPTTREVVWFDDVSLARGIPADTTTTTLRGCTADCGDPVADSFPTTITSTDALYILRTAIGARTCAACICDVNGNGDVNATDALLTLAVAVGEAVTLNCPN